jgi:hypothetical protein
LPNASQTKSTWYLLTFDPPRTSVVDEYHHLNIELNEPALTARVFEDHYDQPVFYDQVPPTQSLSVKQLQILVAGAHRISDAKFAHQLESIRLTERLSDAGLATLEKSLRGKKAREALEILADKSAFFAPPDDEIVAVPPPEIAVQRQLVAKVLSYINSTIPRLPDFLATRISEQYYEFPAGENETWKAAPADQSLHLSQTSKSSIRFSKGKEIVKDETVKMARNMHPQSKNEEILAQAFSPAFHEIKSGGPSSSNLRPATETQELKTVGVFGPILSTVTVALTWSRSQVNWDHWEQGDNGRLAVFSYHVTQGTPFFSAGFCCLPIDNATIPFIQNVPFHGIIAVDPVTGAIMRLTVESDLGWRLPLERSDLMIEYRPVQAESKTFVCPSKSVSISRQRRIATLHEWGETFKIYAPFETDLNEMRFDNYHVFGSTSRILPTYVEAPKNN